MRFLSNLLTVQGSPTADIYFRWSCAAELSTAAIRQIAPTVFLAGRTLIIIRHDAKLRAGLDFDRLIYVIDDDWRAGRSDRDLPLDYRLKLSFVEAQAGPRLEMAADMIIVSSLALQETYQALYPDKLIKILQPFWQGLRANPPRLTPESKTQIAILGARTHRSDFAFLAPIVADLVRSRSDLQFVVSGEAGLPRELIRHPQVTRLPSMNWETYLRWMSGRHFDIGLYRLGASKFNAARSLNKLLEYDMFGAAVIGSQSWTEAQTAAVNGRCILLPDDINAWRRAILRLADNPAARLKISQANRHHICKQPDVSQQSRFWQEVLGS